MWTYQTFMQVFLLQLLSLAPLRFPWILTMNLYPWRWSSLSFSQSERVWLWPLGYLTAERCPLPAHRCDHCCHIGHEALGLNGALGKGNMDKSACVCLSSARLHSRGFPVYSSISHLFIQHLLNIYNVPGIVLGTGDTGRNKTDMVSAFMELII